MRRDKKTKKQRSRSNWSRHKINQKKIFTNLSSKAKKEKNKKIEGQAISKSRLLSVLHGHENFLGVFASNQLENVRILSFPGSWFILFLSLNEIL